MPGPKKVNVNQETPNEGQRWYGGYIGQPFDLKLQSNDDETVILDDGLEYYQVTMDSFKATPNSIPYVEGVDLYVLTIDAMLTPPV